MRCSPEESPFAGGQLKAVTTVSYPLLLVSPTTSHQPSSRFPGKNGAITGPDCSSSRSRSTITFTGEPLQITIHQHQVRDSNWWLMLKKTIRFFVNCYQRHKQFDLSRWQAPPLSFYGALATATVTKTKSRYFKLYCAFSILFSSTNIGYFTKKKDTVLRSPPPQNVKLCTLMS